MVLREEEVTSEIYIPFPNAELADAAYKALYLDYQGGNDVHKQLTLQDNILKAEFSGLDLKKMAVEELHFKSTSDKSRSENARVSELNEELLSGPQPSPNRSTYGFTLYLGSTGGFIVYIIWAVVPKLETGGLEFALPSRYWAVALPIWFLVTLATVAFLFYPAVNAIMAPEPSSPRALADSYSKPMPEGEPRRIPQIYDMDPALVSRLLYMQDQQHIPDSSQES